MKNELGEERTIEGKMAPFKKFQRITCCAAMLLLPIYIIFDMGTSKAHTWVLAGYLTYMAIDFLVYCGDRYLAEKFGYQCRDCGQCYSADGMKPMRTEPCHKIVNKS